MTTVEDYISSATAIMTRNAHPTQAFGHLRPMPIASQESARRQSVENLNQLLADTMTLRLGQAVRWRGDVAQFACR